MKSVKLRVFVAVVAVMACASQAFGFLEILQEALGDVAKDNVKVVINDLLDAGTDLIGDFFSTDEEMFFKTAQRGGDVTIYIKKGIDVNIKDKVGRTPLFYAANHGRLNTVKTLIDSGADVRIEDMNDKRARDYASDVEIQKTLDDAVGIWGWVKDHPFWTVLIVIVGLIFIGAAH
ncbi:MAG: ankyrin repeat domain-containing protein [Synergistaceae bacterium]|nr:ankyrin repeat domain-containing protein [Synergistaceae bacterium]